MAMQHLCILRSNCLTNCSESFAIHATLARNSDHSYATEFDFLCNPIASAVGVLEYTNLDGVAHFPQVDRESGDHIFRAIKACTTYQMENIHPAGDSTKIITACPARMPQPQSVVYAIAQ